MVLYQWQKLKLIIRNIDGKDRLFIYSQREGRLLRELTNEEVERILEPFKYITGVDWNTIIDTSYHEKEWSIECRDKLIHSEGA